MATTTRRAKRSLTDNQRRALARRKSQGEIPETLTDIAFWLERTPEEWRSTALDALAVIIGSGHLFAVACAKAGMSRSNLRCRDWSPAPENVWAFIDRYNLEFRQVMPPDMIAAWSQPTYPEPAAHREDSTVETPTTTRRAVA
jgi:hypothetical protein